MADYDLRLHAMCRHCSNFDTRHLGKCPVCHEAVCDQCGDIYHVRGEKQAIHHTCRAHEESPFKMIKFVKEE